MKISTKFVKKLGLLRFSQRFPSSDSELCNELDVRVGHVAYFHARRTCDDFIYSGGSASAIKSNTHRRPALETKILALPSAPGENISTPVKVGEVAKSGHARTRLWVGQAGNWGPRCIAGL